MTTDDDMLSVARRYHLAGLVVVPPRQDGTKAPYLGTWKRYQRERPEPSEIRKWYSRGLTGIGTVCGAVAGNLELFEFDWYDTYLAFCEVAKEVGLGELVEYVRNGYAERTPGGGIHWYYRCPEVGGSTKLAERPEPTPDNPNGRKALIETKGEGGYSIMSPSHGSVHPTGQPYEVLAGSVEGIVTITPEERKALWDLARSFDEIPAPEATERAPRSESSGDRPGDRFTASSTWRDVLEPHGWKLVYRRGDTGYWRRPGKDIGISATTNHTGNDTLMVFSSSTPFETVPHSYSRFGAYTILNHGGDYGRAGRTLWEEGYRDNGVTATYDTAKPPNVDPETGEILEGPQPLDMAAFWATDHVSEDWLLEPVIPRGRSISIYSPAGQGKSLFALDILTRLAMGRPCLNKPAGEPIDIVYLDYEMSEADLKERLDSMGYGPGDDWSHFHYYLLPDIAPLDTPKGAEALRVIVARHNAAIIALDTTSRIISGEENDADTIRNLYALSILPLKALGVTVLRLDHAGKDLEKGQRGTSAKGDDLDLIWELTVRDEGVRLLAKKRRQNWIPERVDLKRLDDPTRHEVVPKVYVQGTAEMVEKLDALGVSRNASNREVKRLLQALKIPASSNVIGDAIHWRRNHGTPPGTLFGVDPGTLPGTPAEQGEIESRNAPRNASEHFPPVSRNVPPLYEGDVPNPPKVKTLEDDEEEDFLIR